MADWKVSKEQIKLFEHPNADKMQLGRVGDYQVCVQKGVYKDGDIVLFFPEKSLLPDRLAEPYRKYLAGSDKNRVKAARLRGELSMGVIFPINEVADAVDVGAQFSVLEAEIGQDVSSILGIKEWTPPIPVSLAGDVFPLPYVEHFRHHDVDQARIFSDEFTPGEPVDCTEKVHGSQVNITLTPTDEFIVTSKGLAKKGLALKDTERNTYWQAFHNSNLATILRSVRDSYNAQVIQAFGEVVPVQKGYNYGRREPSVLLFDVRVNGTPLTLRELPYSLQHLWVPIITEGLPFDPDALQSLAKGTETVSGNAEHIREGVVVRPVEPRQNSKGRQLLVKFINPEYSDFESIN